jgi:hypothetical protein
MTSQKITPMVFLAVISATGPAAEETATTTVRPADTGQVLQNPDMGWTFHYYSNIITNYGSKLAAADTLDDWPGLSTVYLRLPWSFLEPEEGRFNWSLFDTPAQRWIDKGKQIALRVSCSESWMRWATPEWVAQAGAKGHDFTPGQGVLEDGAFWEPDYNDPVFLDKLDHFLAAMAARYDGNPNVAFIDIGSYGVWGEGHTWASTKLPYDDATRIRHIDLYLKHFKHTLLCVNDDFAGPDAEGVHHPVTDYALSEGITLRDDSICVQPPPQSYFHAQMAGLFWPTLPVVLEHEHYGPSKDRGAWQDGALLLQAVEDYHASYMSIHWWPRELLDENRAVIGKINQRMGYRLQLREASWPAKVQLGQPFEVIWTWANAGVAPCYPGGYPALTLKDQDGGIVSVQVDGTAEMRDLDVGPPGAAPETRFTSTFAVAPDTYGFTPNTQPGVYGVYVSVGRADGTPVIALPLPDGDGHRRYKLGSIELTAR